MSKAPKRQELKVAPSQKTVDFYLKLAKKQAKVFVEAHPAPISGE